MTKVTDKQRVRNRLLEHGSTTPVEWQAPAIDGGKPILRVAARIGELRAEGMDIKTATRTPVARYVLPEPVITDARGQTRLAVANERA